MYRVRGRPTDAHPHARMLKTHITAWAVALAAAALVSPAVAVAADPVIAAAGDIACDPLTNGNYNGGAGTADACRQRYTSDLLVNRGLAAVLPLGDNQYEDATLEKFRTAFAPTWGRVDAISHPVPGNHEYFTAGAAGYFSYFGAAAGDPAKGYYSYDLAGGNWHLIALNSNCDKLDPGTASDGCAAGSPQEQWLRSDLAAHPNSCVLAYWHHPLFTSGIGISPAVSMKPIWQDLYGAGADVVLNGHAHGYERFAPQNSDGTADATRGIRELTVGSGGEDHVGFNSPVANSEAQNADTFGVLDLTLRRTGFEWRFVPEAGATFNESGNQSCHHPAPPAAPSITSPADGSYNATGSVALSGSAEANTVVTVYDGGASKGTTTADGSGNWSKTLSPVADGSHTYTATAADTGLSNNSSASGAVTVTVDTQRPSSSAASSASSSSSPIAVSYTAADVSPGSGLASVELWVKRPGDASYSRAAIDSAPGGTGSFSYNATAGDGAYAFYTVAVDKAGNREAPPAAPPDSTTQLSTPPPPSGGGTVATTGGSAAQVSPPPPGLPPALPPPKTVTGWTIPRTQRIRAGQVYGYVTLGAKAASVEGQALASGKARRALAARSSVVAKTVRRGAAAGQLKVVVRFTARVRNRLRNLRRISVTLRLIVTPPGGRPVAISRAVTLRR